MSGTRKRYERTNEMGLAIIIARRSDLARKVALQLWFFVFFYTLSFIVFSIHCCKCVIVIIDSSGRIFQLCYIVNKVEPELLIIYMIHLGII